MVSNRKIYKIGNSGIFEMKLVFSLRRFKCVKYVRELVNKTFLDTIKKKKGEVTYPFDAPNVRKALHSSDLIVYNENHLQKHINTLGPDYLCGDYGYTKSLDDIMAEYEEIQELVNNRFINKTQCLCSNPDKDITNKRSAAFILKNLGVNSPNTVLAELVNPEEVTYPVFVKHKELENGKGTHFVEDEYELSSILEQNASDYVVQEAIKIPTQYASHIRVLTFGDHIVGSMIYYNKDHAEITNKTGTSHQIALTGRNWRKQSSIDEQQVLDAYNIKKKLGLPSKIKKDAAKIGRYASEHGVQILGLDFVADKNNNYYCIDINGKPGLGIFNVLYGKKSWIPSKELAELAGKTLGRKFMSW